MMVCKLGAKCHSYKLRSTTNHNSMVVGGSNDVKLGMSIESYDFLLLVNSDITAVLCNAVMQQKN